MRRVRIIPKYKEGEYKFIDFDLIYECPYCYKVYRLHDKSDLIRESFECKCGAQIDFQIDIEFSGAVVRKG